MTFINERTFYRRKCDLCNSNIIAIFPKESTFPIFCPPCWWSDKWDTMNYGKEYDFSKPFFIQFNELLKKVPKISLYIDYPRIVNSEFVHLAGALKNCYLIMNCEDDENCCYSYNITHSKDCVDCSNIFYTTSSYEAVDCQRCYRALYSTNCHNSIDIYFSKNLHNCENCFGCINLRNKKYHIFNKPSSKEDYFQFIKNCNLGSYKEILRYKEKVQNLYLTIPNKFMEGYRNFNVSGNNIFNSKNVFHSFDILDAENCKFCRQFNMYSVKDSYDYSNWGKNASLVYESINVGEDISNVKFSYSLFVGQNITYCDVTYSSNNIFGCISLRNKDYCILNKQYAKEEYEDLVPKIIQHMQEMPYVDKKGRIYKYGEFFPLELSPFAYNETIAQEYFPLTKQQAIDRGYNWKDPEEKNYNIQISNNNLPDNIKDANEDIVGKVIECAHGSPSTGSGQIGKPICDEQCATAFKIIKEELQFYKKMNLPLPRLCPNCRHYQRLKQRNPLKLWHRQCMCDYQVYNNTVKHPQHPEGRCPNEFQTSYSPERSEIVYCEQCYSAEVV
jgi:hypothetical protein